jgi:hypothetical protein
MLAFSEVSERVEQIGEKKQNGQPGLGVARVKSASG